MTLKYRLLNITLWLVAIPLTWLVAITITIWNYGNQDYAKISDCIIVLGGAVYGNKPSPVFEERIKHSIHLFNNGKAGKIIFTGGYGVGDSHAESEVGALYALNAGVNQSAILTETHSRTTRQNLIEAKMLMKANALKSAIIVSDPLHLKRASLMAMDLDIPAVTSPTPTSRYRSMRAKLEFLASEVYLYHYYLVTGE